MSNAIGSSRESNPSYRICYSDKVQLDKKTKQSNLHYTRGTTAKRVTIGGAHLRGSARDQNNSKKHSSGCTLLATLRSISLTRESNPTPPAPIAYAQQPS